jgi:hypothetical protein
MRGRIIFVTQNPSGKSIYRNYETREPVLLIQTSFSDLWFAISLKYHGPWTNITPYQIVLKL